MDAAQTLTRATPAASDFRNPLQETPFWPMMESLCQTKDFLAWNGFRTPESVESTEQEYFAIRNSASLFDLSPMAKYEIRGRDALAFCQRLTTRDVAKLGVGRVSYTLWCDDDGKVIDDGTLFRLADQIFRICCQERQLDFLLRQAIGFAVEIEDVSNAVIGLALQGPLSCYLLKLLGCDGIENLSPFGYKAFALDGNPVHISRTGYTGDLGYEVWLRHDLAAPVWTALMRVGLPRGLRLIGNQALNMARIEAGFLQPSRDFISSESVIRLGFAKSPLELGLDWAVDFKKPYFTGKRALLAEQRDKSSRCLLVGLEVEGNKPAHDALIYADQACKIEIGSVTGALWSPTLKRNIALAIINAPHCFQRQEFWAELYRQRELVWQRRVLKSWRVERPFYAPARRRQTPAPLR
ncbi:MAG: aminomethyltransferase family protein [Candidatus Symbiobacter sp.]|nr:aminomethyltransferase family protein [Candidatus Symbiobacter sp.]